MKATAVAAAAAWVALWGAVGHFAPDPRPAEDAQTPAISAEPAAAVTFQGKDILWWARHAARARHDANARAAHIRELRRELAGNTTIRSAIRLAAIAYRVDAHMLARKGSCESAGGHGFDASATGAPLADGERPLGLFQFIPSTWRRTPFASFSPYNPLAAALAAGWMHSHGRGGEWACR